MDVDIYEVAKQILESGKDRVPRVDKRKIQKLRRHGLLIYPDGYSLTADAMEDAGRWFSMIARDPSANPETAQKLARLAEEAKKWASKHLVTPEIRTLRFGDISFELYYVLWQIATNMRDSETTVDVLPKKHLNPLVRGGYLEPGRIANLIRVTPKGFDLIKEYGNPFLGIKTAERVAVRFSQAQ